MNNSALLEEGTGKLKRNMLEDLDYSLVPAELYTVFVDIYGGGPAIVRNVSVTQARYAPAILTCYI